MAEHPELYRTRAGIVVEVEVPPLAYLAVDGTGDPTGGSGFADAIRSLYSTVYPLKFARRAAAADFRIMPLEALWWTSREGHFDLRVPRRKWTWTLMMHVPNHLTRAELLAARAAARAKHPEPGWSPVRLEILREGRSIQTLHLGPYSAEGPTVARVFAYAADHGLEPAGKHHEIYLSDPRRTRPEAIRTLVRLPVRPSRA